MKSHIPRKPSATVRKAQKQVASFTIDCFTISAMLTLNNTFGFGEKRLRQFLSALEQTILHNADDFSEDLLECLKIRLRNETGIEYSPK